MPSFGRRSKYFPPLQIIFGKVTQSRDTLPSSSCLKPCANVLVAWMLFSLSFHALWDLLRDSQLAGSLKLLIYKLILLCISGESLPLPKDLEIEILRCSHFAALLNGTVPFVRRTVMVMEMRQEQEGKLGPSRL